ncbi:BURP domain protein RD22-like isoform X2 [Prunus avium]|uniref:BURP domain protein RD22-like isoform X2 n=1 Tax=Prunus avium TaxID=42229 RepID=A0A6P5RK00_PRUAV|nr:BURP domain protein RD22-like isoform X2 [Prunus avium]
MGFHLPLIFAFLSLAALALANHAAQPAPQLYWNSVLPNTQMPRAISELLHPDSTNEEKSTNIMNAVGNGKPTDHKVKPDDIFVQESRINYGGPSPSDKPDDIFLPATRIIYGPPPSDNQLHYKNVAIFFLEKDMRPGATMNFQFPRNSNTATFLPRESAQSIPFSSNKLSEIFNHFSVKPTSVEAKTIKKTIEECEAPGIKGEEKYCATSLESMVDFSTSKLRTRNVQAIPTEVLEKGATMSMHKYTTMPGLKKLAGDKVVVCHKQNYPYAVFFCHAIKQTAAYVLSLKGDDGEKVKAVTICHLDTSEWNPKHLAFQILKVKPGTIPICHFLPTDQIVWVPNHKTA